MSKIKRIKNKHEAEHIRRKIERLESACRALLAVCDEHYTHCSNFPWPHIEDVRKALKETPAD